MFLVAVDGVPSLADVPDIYYIHVLGVSAVAGSLLLTVFFQLLSSLAFFHVLNRCNH
jgi:hypothetical protein